MSSIKYILETLGLGKYFHKFDSKNIEFFLQMTDQDLKSLQIPKQDREKLLESKNS